ncbi:dTDP-4-dehydrorhamnose 3,5-epimerase [Coraliomargarita akajimensis]|uniref:dTDP-4-dehydrorhamnose 3,5-epimerase n=1 Tax=Coraliomargarita akajimensis (strain DSM 45221 / IAM 15411 / JCM 23193 / KCTC 12865 / 04OKA010-24) TaxID=583355 RepID=D5EMM1_CORAD|nr:dTDP-4-dehydrorhamnose 3,5-epimerase [Coraliomargarita akajimensis]ADE53427.1 dTDP-4-dehydrorhamnose 3,5-epimerase [Coraliomargarita akajimensis DSM 45221]
MKFTKLPLEGAWLIELEPRGDDRGYFARTYCAQELEAHGIESRVVQSNTSYSRYAGTMRGLHMQQAPHEESKLMRAVAGSFLDVMVDLRPQSPTYLQHYKIELSAQNRRMVYVPGGFAHGFLTLVDHTEALYMVSEYYTPGAETGVRYDDPALGIEWPIPVREVSEKDRTWPLLSIPR